MCRFPSVLVCMLVSLVMVVTGSDSDVCGIASIASAADGQQEHHNTASKPNILFCIADDWSYGHAGAYGNDWVQSPAFDRVARDGLLFRRAYTPNAKCAPSRACILTGRNSWQLEQACNHICFFPAKFTTFVEALGRHGYFVGYTGKGWGPGIANDAQGLRRQMTGRTFNQKKSPPPARQMSSNDYAENFIDFLAAVPANQPWCFWYGASEPHRGYELGAGVRHAGKNVSDIERVPGFWPDTDVIRNDMLDYAVEVEHFDAHAARMLDALQANQQLDNTLVVITSDHGMPFPRCKGQAYDYSNHIPLAIMWKQRIKPTGRIIDDYVSFVDLAPTFLEVAGVAPDRTSMQPMSGTSLTDILFSSESGQVNPERDHVLIGKERHDIGRPHDAGYPIRGIVKNGWLYLRNFEPTRWPAGNPETGYLNCDGSPTKTAILRGRTDPETSRFWQLAFGRRTNEELYDLSTDADCLHNLATTEKFEERKNHLKQQMMHELRDQQDPRILGNGNIFDQYRYSNPGTRNFYERYTRGDKPAAGWVNDSDFESAPLDPGR